MKPLAAFIYFVSLVGGLAQGRMAPIPSVIIICATNQSAPVTFIRTSADSWSVDYVKQQSTATNLKLTCMSGKSVTAKREQDAVLLVLHGATVYGPAVAEGTYGSDQKLQKATIGELSVRLSQRDLIQVNDEILKADRFVQKFKAIPETKTAD